ncbi:helix-turn-helix domain-containing protein [Vibrio pectenicida]
MKILFSLGENITLAMKRRKITQEMMFSRTGISKPTLRKISKGDPSVSIGHYVNVLAVLGLLDDLGKVALDDELGRKLQDIELLKNKR